MLGCRGVDLPSNEQIVNLMLMYLMCFVNCSVMKSVCMKKDVQDQGQKIVHRVNMSDFQGWGKLIKHLVVSCNANKTSDNVPATSIISGGR